MSLTREQIDEFDGYMQKWQSAFGLHGWRIERVPKVTKGALASVLIDYEGHTAFYRIGEWKTTEPSPFNLEQTAVHELLHVLLSDLKQAVKKESDSETVMGLEHGVVNLLEKLLMRTA